jgi:hypothetical protein
MRLVLVLVVAALGTACTAPNTPDGCVVLVPSSDSDVGGFIFNAWMITHATPLDYRDGLWFDANGVIIGISESEDSHICEVAP